MWIGRGVEVRKVRFVLVLLLVCVVYFRLILTMLNLPFSHFQVERV